MPGDPYWGNVVFLSGFEGGSVVDESPLAQTVTLTGSTAATSAQAKFGTKSLDHPASGIASVPDNAAFFSGTSSFTLEAFVRLTSTPSGLIHILSQYDNSGGQAWDWYYFGGTWNLDIMTGGTAHTVITYSHASMTMLDTWYHVAIDFDGTTYRAYVDGTMLDSSTSVYSANNVATVLSIGGVPNGGGTAETGFDGYFDEVRVTAGAARYASDSGFTAPAAAFPRGTSSSLDEAVTDGVGVADGTGFGEVIIAAVTSGVGARQSQVLTWPKALSDNTQIVDQLLYAQGATLSQTVGVGLTQLPQLALLLRDTVRMVEGASTLGKYRQTTSETISVTEALVAGWAMSLTSGVGVAQAQTVLRGVVIAETLGLLQGQVAAARYRLTQAEQARIVDSLGRFFGGDLSDTVGVSEALALLRKTTGAASDTIGLHDTIAPRLLVRLTLTDTVEIDATQALQMFFSPTLLEGVELHAGYLSPSGSVTTWAMNTSTAAVTEYTNYAFNSFASRGSRYYGANDAGLYELSGDSDAGTDIIADIKSGFMQFAGARLGLLKDIYLGTRGSGDYVLRLIAGDGQTYDYAVTTSDMRTTKVHLGKGLRARYWAFELISAGADFDLENVEFVPIASNRRV